MASAALSPLGRLASIRDPSSCPTNMFISDRNRRDICVVLGPIRVVVWFLLASELMVSVPETGSLHCLRNCPHALSKLGTRKLKTSYNLESWPLTGALAKVK